MNYPLISIIIPTFNREHLIWETLDSVLAQTYSNWECIVVDDGSTDNTVEVVQKFIDADARFQYHKRPLDRPKGANSCRNYGVKLSFGDFFMFLDSDDLLQDFCLSKRVQNISTDKIKVYIFTMLRFYKYPGDSNEVVNKNAVSLDTALMMFLRHNLVWPISALLIHKSLKNLTFSEDLQRLQDVAYSINVLLNIKSDEIYFSTNKPDCFYRNILNNDYSLDFVNKLITTFNHYFVYIDKLLVEKCNQKAYLEYKKYHFKCFIFFYQAYFLSNISKINSLSDIKKTLLKRKYIIRFDLLKMSYLEFLYTNNFKRKGLGTYHLIKKWKKREYY